MNTESHRDASALSAMLACHHANRRLCAVTWLNHYSAGVISSVPSLDLASFDYIGVDGKLLQRLSGCPVRTSADLVIPILLPSLTDARVAVIGGSPTHAHNASEQFTRMLGDAGSVVAVMDGYDGLIRADSLRDWISDSRPTVVIVGLGPALQEEVALEIREYLDTGIILTCGGFLDQVNETSYYPRWAYPLRLNWAVRLAREPTRLWRRYSLDVFTAVVRTRRYRRWMESLEGYTYAIRCHNDNHL